jgi:predicted DsbA family dithiol-disulfide isomerase
MNKMKVDIWSDVRCPFCYIGKRKFETALESFPNKGEVEVVWHSFELDSALKTETDKSVYDYLAERKGMSREVSVQMHNQLTQSAKEVGLDYHFDKAVVANSFNAHRLIQLAKTKGLGDAAEERLFKAYYTEGRNIDDLNTLTQLGVEIVLTAIEVGEMLYSNAFADEVRKDQAQAQAMNITGVPFFVIDEKYGVSGAQPSELFSQALEKAWSEHAEENNPKDLATTDGASCDIDGKC